MEEAVRNRKIKALQLLQSIDAQLTEALLAMRPDIDVDLFDTMNFLRTRVQRIERLLKDIQ